MIKYFFSLCMLTFIFGCSSEQKTQNIDNQFIGNIFNDYAKGFQVFKNKNHTLLKVNFQNQSKKYLLVNHKKAIPQNISYDFLIRTPIKSIVSLSSVQVAFLEKLNQLSSIVAVDNKNYIQNKRIKNDSKIIEVGDITTINNELLLSLNADIVMTYPTQGTQENQLISQGIPLIINAEYLEETPLGRAEWIKFMAYFYEEEEKATQLFKEIETSYNQLKSQNKALNKTIFSGKIYQDTWFISGGKSYVASLLKDAGFTYLWEKEQVIGTLPLAIENAFLEAKKADYWFLQVYHPTKYTYEILKDEHPLYSKLKAVQQKKIILVNTANVDYYGKGVVEPHILLQDLTKIIQKDTMTTYYHLLE